MTLLYFVIALSILIVVHEWGHFIVARLSKIRVEKFSIGFGPKIFGIKRGETEYKISALPLGGYVKMSGEDISSVDKNDTAAFYNKSVGTRAAVVAAGPFMNVVLCFLLMPIVFMIGRPEPKFLHDQAVVSNIRVGSPAEKAGIQKGDIIVSAGGKETKEWKAFLDEVVIIPGGDIKVEVLRNEEPVNLDITVGKDLDGRGGYTGVEPHLFIGNEAVLDSIRTGSPSDKAGLKVGDTVVVINGEAVRDWTDMVEFIGKSNGAQVNIEVMRDGVPVRLVMTPEYDETAGRYLIGVSKDMAQRDMPMTVIRYGFIESIKHGFTEATNLAGMTFKVLGKLVTLQLSYKTLGGPVKIAQVTADAARSGLASFLYFLAFLSLQLGILNLLPIPVLDGGHLVFFTIEAIRRKPLNEKVMIVAQNVGMVILVTLLVLVSVNDLLSIEYIRTIIGKIF